MADVYADQLAQSLALLTQVNAAITIVATGGTSYSLDSGQTRQSVTRASLSELKAFRRELMAEIATTQKQVDGTATGGAVYIRPGF